ncbi:MAG: glycosyltransferase family 9 protein [Bacteroidota bacterium]|nr:glycosyltransferase family 9 protein [Bacteroidota bacterium]MDP4233728.1 glycosyltransferase family 9 protein [Bacteroidota bacterium]MDP4242367.1 glycosyltransferase family 9 protein [Bacteroidota bacterium]MDP4288680.1 glycosyltransferase family 9 protein [Bacteroidota bacterium]
MTNTGFSKLGLRLLDRMTDRAPFWVPRLFQRMLLGILGRPVVYQWYLRRYRKQWQSVRSPSKILLIVDINIGDAVLGAQCLPLLQAEFPEAEVHLACNQSGGELLERMPGIFVHNMFRGMRGMPSNEDLARLRALLHCERFSVVLNMCPFISKRTLATHTHHQVLQLYVPFAAYVFRAWKTNEERHVSLLARTFLHEFLENHGAARMEHDEDRIGEFEQHLNTNAVYLGIDAIEDARQFLRTHNLRVGSGMIFYHVDATSRFGLVPFKVLVRLLRHALDNDEISSVLLGQPFTFANLHEQLIRAIPPELKKKLVVIPHVPLGVYTALMDACDMFVAGDTGPLHIAACRKVSADGYPVLRNQTAVLAIYGATDSRMYGYDSTLPYHVPANQDVPSRSVAAPTPCRNITCINKYGKFCQEVRCFDELPVSSIEAHIDSHFHRVAMNRPFQITIPAADRSAISERAFAH